MLARSPDSLRSRTDRHRPSIPQPVTSHPVVATGQRLGADGGHGAIRLPPDFDEALDGSERGEYQQQPHHRYQQDTGEEQAHTDDNDALGPFHEATLGIKTVNLCLGPHVRDEGGDAQNGERQHGVVAALDGLQMPPDTAHQKCIGDAVGGGVEEGATHGRRLRGLRHRPVEQVRQG